VAQDRVDPGASGVPVHIPSALWYRIQSHIEDTPFASVEDFVAYAVREALSNDAPPSTGLSAEEERRVKARLRALGYLE
jgi:Arc/MetJ-type ribon-helix-helix transcriptional regulator